LHPLLARKRRVGRGERLLDGDRAVERLDDARELGEDAVASRAEDLAVGAENQVVDDLAVRGERRQRPLLVGMHQPRVAFHVGGEDRRELSLERRGFHVAIAARFRSGGVNRLGRAGASPRRHTSIARRATVEKRLAGPKAPADTRES
jgi:hypothetical protein